jgi:hypothetical protein
VTAESYLQMVGWTCDFALLIPVGKLRKPHRIVNGFKNPRIQHP